MTATEALGRQWEEFESGQRFRTGSRTVDGGDVARFARLSGDFSPLHVDEEFARATPFGGRVAHGMLVLALAAGLQNQLGIFEGTALALLGLGPVRFTRPVRLGDTIHTEMVVREVRESPEPDRGIVVLEVTVKNQRGEAVLQYEESVLLARRFPGPRSSPADDPG